MIVYLSGTPGHGNKLKRIAQYARTDMLGRTEKTMLSASCRYMIDKIAMGRVHTSNKHGNASTLFRGDHNKQASVRLLYPPHPHFPVLEYIHTIEDANRNLQPGLAHRPCFHCTEAEYVASGREHSLSAIEIPITVCFARIRCRNSQLHVLTPGQPRPSTRLKVCCARTPRQARHTGRSGKLQIWTCAAVSVC